MRVLIIDDEQRIIEGIINMIHLLGYSFQDISSANSIEVAYEHIKDNQVDLVFLDVEIGEKTGFDLLERLGKINFQLIFITAYQKYAIKGFKYSAIDFLLKPIDPIELQRAIIKAQENQQIYIIEEQLSLLRSTIKEHGESKKIVLRNSDGIHIEQIKDIVRCEADGSYTTFITSLGERIVVSKVLKDYEELLEKNNFIRIHNSHMINMDRVKKVFKNDYEVLMDNNERVPISQRRKSELLGKLIN